MKRVIDMFNDTTALALVDKKTHKSVGSIVARWGSGGACHALLRFKFQGEWYCEEGHAGGWGYDKFSAAVSDALSKTPFHGNHEQLAPFVFCNSSEEYANRKREGAKLKRKHIIPVYSGAGNVGEAFSLYFDVIEIL